MTTPPPLIALIDYSSRPTAPQLHALLAQLRPGQTLRALVTEVLGRVEPQPAPAAVYRGTPMPDAVPPRPGGTPATTTEPAPGHIVRLRLGTTQVTAHTQQPLRAGQRIDVQVSRTQPLVELRVLPSTPQLPAREALLQSALPRQLPTRDWLPALRTLLSQSQLQLPAQTQPTTTADAARDTVPAAARPLLNALVDRPVPLARLSAPVLREQLASSGLLLERTLSGGRIPTADMKLDLLRLLGLLQAGVPRQRVAADAPGTQSPQRPAASDGGGLIDRLLRLLDGGLARVQTQQAAALPAEQGVRQSWQFDLPLLVGNQVDEVQMRVERESHDDDDSAAAATDGEWRVQLHFEWQRLGAIDVSLRLRGERVSTVFWCERAATQRLIGTRMPKLEAAMLHVGLEVGQMTAVRGTAPDPIALPQPAQGLLDAHA